MVDLRDHDLNFTGRSGYHTLSAIFTLNFISAAVEISSPISSQNETAWTL